MKLYMFECGTLKSQKHLFTMGRGIGEPFDVPVPFFLIEHEKGKVLYDTGNALEVARDKVKHWGAAVVGAYDPIMTEDQYVVNQLKKVGVKPEEITHVIFSHLHLDHAGGCGGSPMPSTSSSEPRCCTPTYLTSIRRGPTSGPTLPSPTSIGTCWRATRKTSMTSSAMAS